MYSFIFYNITYTFRLKATLFIYDSAEEHTATMLYKLPDFQDI